MDRYTDISQEITDQIAARVKQESDDGYDDDLPPEDRKNRAVIAQYQDENGDWQDSKLKKDDDVQWVSVVPGRVAGPARGRDWLSICYDPWFGDTPCPIHISYITDRAPADPQAEEEPYFPVIPPPETENMQARAAIAPGSETGKSNPKQAAKAERQDARAGRRELKDQLREMLEHIKDAKQKKLLKQALKKHLHLKDD
jgi:hypothetical protein